jgi:hypothetical protein
MKASTNVSLQKLKLALIFLGLYTNCKADM